MPENTEPMPDSLLSLITKESVSLFSGRDNEREGSLQSVVFKKAQGEEGASRQGIVLGEQPHPFDFAQVKSFITGNEHHATCIHTKVAATVGLGFLDSQQEVVIESPIAESIAPAGRDERSGLPAAEQLPMPRTRKEYVDSKVDKAINPLCMISATDLLNDACEDYWQVGNGMIEVVREKSSMKIVGLHHLPAEESVIFLEDSNYNFHYVIRSGDEATERRFARFGDWEEFEKRSKEDGSTPFDMPEEQIDSDLISEVIHIRQPTASSRWYGFPKWLSAVPAIELAQMLMQWKYDFFLNRGVPEFIFLLTGQKLSSTDWAKIENALKSNIGLGNSHKSIALNISNPEVKAHIEKLGLDSSGEDSFAPTKESLALSVVTAHMVPPLLAGIQIPGKLGATNELPNALMAFQILVIGQAQRIWQQTFDVTLGSDKGIEGLVGKDFAMTKITEEIDLGTMDTVARMRQSPMQATAEGRNMNEGVKD